MDGWEFPNQNTLQRYQKSTTITSLQLYGWISIKCQTKFKYKERCHRDRKPWIDSNGKIGVDFTNIFIRGFYKHRSQKRKKDSQVWCLLALLGSVLAKRWMKLTPLVNFINIFRAAFSPIFSNILLPKKITKPNCN